MTIQKILKFGAVVAYSVFGIITAAMLIGTLMPIMMDMMIGVPLTAFNFTKGILILFVPLIGFLALWMSGLWWLIE